MSKGSYISIIGHMLLVIWLLLGWGLSHDPLDFQISEITVVSGEEFEAMVKATSPNPDITEPPAPDAPVIDVTPPTPEIDAPPAAAPAPEPTTAPDTEAAPAAPATPEPPAAVVDVAPTQPQPAPPPSADVNDSTRPQPRPAPRVAPTPAPPPPPEADVADISRDAVTPDAETPAEVVQEAVTAAAPEEAAPEIVTEAERPSGAVTSSLRPQSRPARPTQPAPQPATETAATTDTDAVAEALAAAASSSAPAAAPEGPPMTGSEKDAFRIAVNACWNVDPGAEWARVTVVVGFGLDQAGKVLGGDVRLVSASGGTETQADAAFQAARRAILRCQSSGYQLPADKYDWWKDVEITFDPTGMRLR